MAFFLKKSENLPQAHSHLVFVVKNILRMRSLFFISYTTFDHISSFNRSIIIIEAPFL
ncbi:unknown protein [Parachlamydia acanthamoebae UV-7]|uniref:Uncharacterized protein n=2 Tax=Parachlamydia acanthamoebae TaxID=83552 RepID=F8KYG7_PARAV|nr:unknown protein [Parachlamydia acanthamoebae UV-7]